MQDAIARLDAFTGLGDDWDSYGAVPINPLAIDIARSLVDQITVLVRQSQSGFPHLDVIPDVVPMPDGGVQLEWDTNDMHLEIEIGPDGIFSYLLVPRMGEGRFRESGELESIYEIMRLINSRL